MSAPASSIAALRRSSEEAPITVVSTRGLAMLNWSAAALRETPDAAHARDIAWIASRTSAGASRYP